VERGGEENGERGKGKGEGRDKGREEFEKVREGEEKLYGTFNVR